MAFPKPWAKHSLEFSHFFLNQFFDLENKNQAGTYSSNKQSTNFVRGRNYLYDCYYSISKTEAWAKRIKRPINTHGVSQKQENLRKLVIQVIMITGIQKCSIKKLF